MTHPLPISSLLTAKLITKGKWLFSQYAGDPIDCIKDHKMDDDTFDKYCWVEGTWTWRHTPQVAADAALGRSKASLKSDLRAVGCFDESSDPARDCWHHQYYQWVALVLLLQAGCFYFPRYLSTFHRPVIGKARFLKGTCGKSGRAAASALW